MPLHQRSDLFQRIDERIASGEHAGLSIEFGKVHLTPYQARDAVRGLAGDTTLRDMVWREAILAAQREEPGDDMARLFAVWLGEPWMRRAISMVSAWIRVSHEDLEAEMVTSFLEGLTSADAESPGASDKLLKSAANRTCSAVRSGRREILLEDPAILIPPDDLDLFTRDRWELEITPPGRADGLSAPIRFTASPTQIEGERLGMLAHRLGLQDIVYRARRPPEGRPIGALSLRRVGAA
ncbi:hypothetical protein GCM10022224_041820 [Nonomuraea antimicrobica]|uniref:Uncharacterized protein n=1 Tax=Nonomuraea antimicrobica TaxID=561173 RepID=A0ABP7BY11_9ACTN